ncbi:unnamed protein product [Pleuronectes platessa]|uniref:Uncharacterized protein n=1 Tax=Pleuronectes platessa TaxID=8262 RepID=A0A9N7TM49_PLEPL|nr:unnamed protein product [Pleuronectes platessa]
MVPSDRAEQVRRGSLEHYVGTTVSWLLITEVDGDRNKRPVKRRQWACNTRGIKGQTGTAATPAAVMQPSSNHLTNGCGILLHTSSSLLVLPNATSSSSGAPSLMPPPPLQVLPNATSSSSGARSLMPPPAAAGPLLRSDEEGCIHLVCRHE